MSDTPLRRGWTTGACATAAATAAFTALRTGAFPDPVTIALPRGLAPCFALATRRLEPDGATAGVVKDAGDDPDITHGAEILATVRPGGSGVSFRAGEGVGTVTLPGLPLAIGEPAINPMPRAMIRDNLAQLNGGREPDLEVTVSIPGGVALAARTMNGRLGIIGGLSILGTTGVVIPYSCSAWVESLRQGVAVARALGVDRVVGCTGKTSETLARRLLPLPDQAFLDMGDFAGALLKTLRTQPVARLTIAGGFAKLVKLAAGEMDLHSSRSRVDPAFLAGLLAEAGAPGPLVDQAARAVSAAQVLALAGDLPLGDVVARRAREVTLAVLSGGTAVSVLVVDRAGRLVGRVDG
jgi:cobalt-precorrin-5B (C1)-methyltransferase